MIGQPLLVGEGGSLFLRIFRVWWKYFSVIFQAFAKPLFGSTKYFHICGNETLGVPMRPDGLGGSAPLQSER